MSRQESERPVLANLLAWERHSTRTADPIAGEYVVPGRVDGFVDQAAAYVTALREAGEIDGVMDRANQFESLTAPGSALDAARIAIQPIVKAFANAKEGIGGVEWAMSSPSRPVDDGFIRHRRTPHVVPHDVVSVIAQLGTSFDCFRWNPIKSNRSVRTLLSYSLEPPLPNRESLVQLDKLMGELWLNAEQGTAWGCWLPIQCNEAARQLPPAFAQLAWIPTARIELKISGAGASRFS